MIAGHFGLAAGAKAFAPRVPLWALMLSTFLLDVVFIALNVGGLEYITPADPSRPSGYGSGLIHAYYTHSLLGALAIAAGAALLARIWWGGRGGIIVGAVVFSHWLLDLLVHRADLPLLPGNFGDLPLLGAGLWRLPVGSIAVELALVVAGALLYYRSAAGLRVPANTAPSVQRRRVIVASGVTAALLLLLLTADVLGL